MAFLESAETYYRVIGTKETTEAKKRPIIDNIFHGCERIAFAFICKETQLKLGDHDAILREFTKVFSQQDRMTKELTDFYAEIKSVNYRALYQFDVTITNATLAEYITLAQKFKQRAILYAKAREWIK